jgi:hypothetical protein
MIIPFNHHVNPSKVSLKAVVDGIVYEVNIIKRKGSRCKIHFKGY